MICEKCGKKLDSLLIYKFNYDGSDSLYRYSFTECEENAVTIDVNHNWTGYGLSEEEQKDSICCPHCNQFPFISEEIQVEEVVRIICFKKSNKD